MSKTELVEFIAENADLTKADAARALEAVMEGVTTGLKETGKVFAAVLEDAGVFKCTEEGRSAFRKFVSAL